MKIVIDIDKDDFNAICHGELIGVLNDDNYTIQVNLPLVEIITTAFQDGIILPKGHGALIDEKNLLDKWNNSSVRGRTEFDQVIMCTPVVISADKGE